MFTSFDKALTALVMAIIFFANYFHVFSLNIDPAALGALFLAAQPFITYFFPNKTTTPSA